MQRVRNTEKGEKSSNGRILQDVYLQEGETKIKVIRTLKFNQLNILQILEKYDPATCLVTFSTPVNKT